MRTTRLIVAVILMGLTMSFSTAPARAAVSVGKAEFKGSTLRVEGQDAVAGSTVTVRSADSLAAVQADDRGRWEIQADNFSAPDCVVAVDDGTGAVGLTLNGCAPVAALPLPPEPAPAPPPEPAPAPPPEPAPAPPPPEPAPAPVPEPAPASQGVLESNQAWSGSFDSALMGASVASAGDVNGDGFDDVVVGAPGYDAAGGQFDEGAVFVFLGSPTGVIGNSPTTAHAAIIGNAANSEFGTSVNGTGDINGDGFDDIIVGAPLTNTAGLPASGAAYIFLGGPSGITATSPANANSVLESRQIRAWLGHDVAGAGDVNGDGFDDVIVGAPLYGQPFNPPIPNQGSGQQGAAFVFLGSASGLVGNSPADAHATLVPVSDGAPSQIRAFFGGAVDGAGDINADGYADIVIGVPGWNGNRRWPGLDSGEPPNEGTAFIYLGGPSGITGTNPTNAAARIDGDQLDALMGNDVAGVGDVNGDGFDDVLVGASGYPAGDPLLGSQEGAAFLFLGGPAGISAGSAAQAQWSARGTLGGERLGRAVGSAGDVNGDGLSDVIIGARTFPGLLQTTLCTTVASGSRVRVSPICSPLVPQVLRRLQ